MSAERRRRRSIDANGVHAPLLYILLLFYDADYSHGVSRAIADGLESVLPYYRACGDLTEIQIWISSRSRYGLRTKPVCICSVRSSHSYLSYHHQHRKQSEGASGAARALLLPSSRRGSRVCGTETGNSKTNIAAKYEPRNSNYQQTGPIAYASAALVGQPSDRPPTPSPSWSPCVCERRRGVGTTC